MKWYFTFMSRQTLLATRFVCFEGTFAEARKQMFDNFGEMWAFQYNEEEFKRQSELYELKELK